MYRAFKMEMCKTNTTNMKYPIGIQTFEKIIEGGYVYVDKTELVYKLVSSGEYYFISREDFEQHIQNDDFIEYEQVYEGLYYGTLKSEIDRIQSAGRTIVFDIDVKGGINLKRIFGKEALAIFIAPPSVEELSRRLHGRGDTSEEMIQKRLAKAEIEMADAPYFDHIVVNDDLTKAKHELDKLVR